jgi:hypothetical protein
MQNATYLTERYPGRERELWTPCFYDFFRRYEPDLPVSACIEFPSPAGPWYESRRRIPFLGIKGDIIRERWPDEFLPTAEARFGLNLMNDPARFPARGDIAGICPDIVVIRPEKQGLYVIEVKPYYESSFDGNQGPGGAYIDFVIWLNKRDVPCEYLVVQSISLQAYPIVKQIQDALRDHFGVLLLEDIFAEMGKCAFSYPPITERWSDFTDKGTDFA